MLLHVTVCRCATCRLKEVTLDFLFDTCSLFYRLNLPDMTEKDKHNTKTSFLII